MQVCMHSQVTAQYLAFVIMWDFISAMGRRNVTIQPQANKDSGMRRVKHNPPTYADSMSHDSLGLFLKRPLSYWNYNSQRQSETSIRVNSEEQRQRFSICVVTNCSFNLQWQSGSTEASWRVSIALPWNASQFQITALWIPAICVSPATTR